MMNPIPFIGRIGPDERGTWLAALNAALSGRAEVRPIDDLTQGEKAGARVAVVANPDPAELETLPRLEWVQSLWAGVERLVAEVPESVGIVRMVDPQLAETMAEAALTFTLYLHRDVPLYRAQQQRREWRQHHVALPSERTVGVLGLGKLGQRCAHRLLDNGFKVCGWSRSGGQVAGVEVFSGDEGLTKTLGRSDILLILLPLTPETRHLIDASALSCLPRGAGIINFARGAIIDDEALIAALDDGRVGHAVLDVFAVEPLPEASPYWSHRQVTVLPHISSPTNPATASLIAARNIVRYLDEGAIPETVERARGY